MFTKTAKKIVGFVIMTTLVLTSMSFGVFAQTLTDVNTAESASTFTANPGTKTEVSVVTGVGGKAATDSAFAFKMKDSSLVAASGNYVQPLGNLDDVTKPNVYEMSFMLPNGSAGVNLPTQMWIYVGGSNSNSELTMKITADGFAPGGNYSGVVPGTAFEYDKWYNLAIVFPYAGTANYGETMLVYVNGDLKAEISKYHYTNEYRYVRGVRRIRMSPVSGENGSVYAYFDNLRQYAGTYAPENDAAPSLEIADSTKIASVADGRIALNETLSVEQLKGALTTNGTVRIYTPAGVLLTDSDIIPDNSTLVAAFSNATGMERTYAYYNVAKEAVVLGGTMYDGSTVMAGGTQTTVQTVDGTFGKTDKVYAFSSVANGSISSTTGYHPEPFAIVQSGDASQKVLELAFMLPEGSTGLGLTAHQWQGGASSGNPEHTIKISTTGIRIEYEDPTVLNYNFEYNKWYNIAIVLPGKTADNAYGYRATLYVNGKNAGVFPMVDTIGIRRLRIHALSTSDTANVFAYIDNLRMSDRVYSNGKYDAEDTVVTSTFTTDAAKDRFYVTSSVTAQAVLADITDLNDDTDVFVFDAAGNTITGDALVTDGCTVAVASKGGTNLVRTVSYYDVENIAGEFVVITPEISYAENTVRASITAINNTSVSQSLSAVFAEYGEGLIECVPVVCDIPVGEKITFSDGISIEYAQDNIVRFFTWKNTTNDITPLLEDIRVW